MTRAWRLIVLVALAGCGTDLGGGGGTYDLDVTGSGFTADEGQTLWLAVVRTDTGAIVATDSATISAGAFSFAFTALLDPGVAYEIDYFADVNGDGRCDAGTDHPWVRLVSPPTDNVVLTLTFNTSYDAQACSRF